MSWRGMAGGVAAARAGHDVVMTPTASCYFDYRQSGEGQEPGAWYAVLTLRQVRARDGGRRRLGTLAGARGAR